MFKRSSAPGRRAARGPAVGVVAVALALVLMGCSQPSAGTVSSLVNRDVVAAAAPSGTTLYVAPTGSGTACSRTVPCSLNQGKSAAEHAEAATAQNVRVRLFGGVYRLASTFTLGSADSGRDGHTVSYEAVGGQQPVLSGGVTLGTWTLHDRARNIWVAALPRGVAPHQIYVGGQAAQIVRRSAPVLGTLTQTSTGYTTTSSVLSSWGNVSAVDFDYPGGGTRISAHGAWTDAICGVQSVHGHTIVMRQPCYANAKNPTSGSGITLPTAVENAYALLGQPGQFYADTKHHSIYYVPRAGDSMNTVKVIAPKLQTLLRVGGSATVSNLHITGLAFRYADWTPSQSDGVVPGQADVLETGSPGRVLLSTMPNAVEVHGAKHVTFSRDEFSHLGGGGLSFDGHGSYNTVSGNSFTDIQGNGLTVGAVQQRGPTSLLETHYSIVNNSVHHVATRYIGGVGIFVGIASYTSVSHNEVWDVPYTGVSVGWGWNPRVDVGMQHNHIDDNFVHDTMTSALSDGGGIYVVGAQHGAANATTSTITGNFVSGVAQIKGGIYLDGGASKWLVTKNVVAHVRGLNWVFINENNYQQGRGNTIRGNYADSRGNIADQSINAVSGNTTGLTKWPAAAAATIRNAGVQPAYRKALAASTITNLAYGAATRSSSQLDGMHAASAADDGRAASAWASAAADTSPSWQVDLGKRHTLSSIQALMPQSVNQPSARQNLKIQVSNGTTGSKWVTACSLGSGQLAFRDAWNCTPPAGTWRYVRVTRATAGSMSLAEVRVYGS